MPIELRWLDTEKTVISYTFVVPHTWAEFHEANTKCWQMIDNTTRPIDLILNVSQVDHIPSNAHIHIPNALQTTHPRLNMIVFVGLNVYTRTIKNAMQRLFPYKLNNSRIAWNTEDAMKLIQDSRMFESVG